MDNKCILNKPCPSGYYRKDLEDIARNCGMSDEQIASKNMISLCSSISSREYFPNAEDLPCKITPRLCKSSKYSRQDLSDLVQKCNVDMSHVLGYHTRPMLCQALHDASMQGAPCRLTKSCPSGYKRADLVRIANKCNIDVTGYDGTKKMGELCSDIKLYINEQSEIDASNLEIIKQDLLSDGFEIQDLIDFTQEEIPDPSTTQFNSPPPVLQKISDPESSIIPTVSQSYLLQNISPDVDDVDDDYTPLSQISSLSQTPIITSEEIFAEEIPLLNQPIVTKEDIMDFFKRLPPTYKPIVSNDETLFKEDVSSNDSSVDSDWISGIEGAVDVTNPYTGYDDKTSSSNSSDDNEWLAGVEAAYLQSRMFK